LSNVGRYDAADALLASYGAVTKAIAAGQITPSEAVEIITILDAHRAAIETLKPDAMREAPPPEQLERQRRVAARQIEIDKQNEALCNSLVFGKPSP
jgi:hypothetical protein